MLIKVYETVNAWMRGKVSRRRFFSFTKIVNVQVIERISCEFLFERWFVLLMFIISHGKIVRGGNANARSDVRKAYTSHSSIITNSLLKKFQSVVAV